LGAHRQPDDVLFMKRYSGQSPFAYSWSEKSVSGVVEGWARHCALECPLHAIHEIGGLAILWGIFGEEDADERRLRNQPRKNVSHRWDNRLGHPQSGFGKAPDPVRYSAVVKRELGEPEHLLAGAGRWPALDEHVFTVRVTGLKRERRTDSQTARRRDEALPTIQGYGCLLARIDVQALAAQPVHGPCFHAYAQKKVAQPLPLDPRVHCKMVEMPIIADGSKLRERSESSRVIDTNSQYASLEITKLHAVSKPSSGPRRCIDRVDDVI
jgi:hypothetical protein